MKRLGSLPIVLALLASLASPRPGLAGCGCIEITEMVEMSDGVHLDASLYLPEVPDLLPDGTVPVVVRQHGGGSNKDNDYDLGYGLELVKSRKFALVMYSHRGHGNSEGSFDFFGTRTTLDFSEILDWAAGASPKNSSVQPIADTTNTGVSGYSQGGGESLLPAANDPRVRAAAVGNTFDSLNRALNPDDCFKFSFATGIFALAYKAAAARTDDTLAARWGAQWYSDTEDVGTEEVPSTTDDVEARSPLAYLRFDASRPMYAHGLQIPVFWSNSWEDQLFPADHGLQILSDLKLRGFPVHYWFASGGHAAGPNDPADEAGKEAAMRRWMDEFLRGADHGFRPTDASPVPEVDYAERLTPGEAGTWTHRTAPAWPAATSASTLYPSSEGSLAASGEAEGTVVGTFANDLASFNVANDALTHEVPRQVDNGFVGGGGPDPGFRRAPDAAPESPNPADTLTFTSAPLGSGIHVVGAPVVRIKHRTSAQRVAQFSAKVWDVDADGVRRIIWRGCTSDETPSDGEASISLWPNAHTFLEGRRIQLTVSTVDFPTFKPDTEPHVTSLLAGTRLDLPTR